MTTTELVSDLVELMGKCQGRAAIAAKTALGLAGAHEHRQFASRHRKGVKRHTGQRREKIAEGQAADVMNSDAVKKAYLGAEA